MINVVIAEDDFRVAQIHEAFLGEISGVHLLGKAINASDTLKLLDSNSVDLLLLDVYMPDQLGTDLLHKIRLAHPGIDIIMITASNDKSFLEKALEYGVFQYLIKPVQLEQFKQTMEQYRKKKRFIDSTSKVNQEVLEQLFGNHAKKEIKTLPPGIDSLTLGKVIELIQSNSDGLTSENVGQKMGASRTTARRYLEYLVRIDQVRAESVYGIVGRPERRYFYKG
ncbi:DNA-binding response regulator [Virgibacillus phasianinus]|uniref:DNA-binding response regulator n=1 Tax=Virgibacillus phasianinus TaxID=2017483 RepID=A0A220U3U4_9BACI|nr:response regulator [Virgibacillus phasianinus]ASK62652.1 DNA-binding response regulator [Virgibacillus phasianinus]